MTIHIQFLIRYGYALLFGWVFAEQMGLPIPSIPILLTAGAMVGTHDLRAAPALASPIVAAIIADVTWYQLGRHKGIRILQFLCRISLEPDSCVRRTENVFARSGAKSLLISKFVPGLNTAAQPLAGIFHMKFRRFLLIDVAGAIIYVSTFLALGYAFSDQLEDIAAVAARFGISVVTILFLALVTWLSWKYYRRQRFIRQLRIDRITAAELKGMLDAGEEVVIVDLRGSLDFEAEPAMIPGAVHLDAADLEEVSDELAKAPEVVLYCNCPNEVTSARMALLLRRKGVQKIRPLTGGLDGWREQGYPVAKNTESTREAS